MHAILSQIDAFAPSLAILTGMSRSAAFRKTVSAVASPAWRISDAVITLQLREYLTAARRTQNPEGS
jgi:hypothetical protein